MKSCLSLLGVVFIFVIAGVGFLIYKGSALDASSKKYVDEVLPAIVKSWDKEEFLKHVSPEFKTKVKDNELAALFAKSSSILGPLVEYKGSNGEAKMSYTTWTGKMFTASYQANAEFQHGPARLDIRLIQHGANWQIFYFYVSSPSFLNAPAPAPQNGSYRNPLDRAAH